MINYDLATLRTLTNEAYDCFMRLHVEYISSLNDETIKRIKDKLEKRYYRRYAKLNERIRDIHY